MAGGSPIASPTSRWAIAKRVTESIISITSLPCVAEVLGDRGRREGRPDAHQRRLVGGGDDHDRVRERVAEVALDELAHLAAALADQRDHVDLGRGRAGDHAQQRGLADARAGEDAEALAAAARDKRVERADAEADAVGDPRAA